MEMWKYYKLLGSVPSRAWRCISWMYNPALFSIIHSFILFPEFDCMILLFCWCMQNPGGINGLSHAKVDKICEEADNIVVSLIKILLLWLLHYLFHFNRVVCQTGSAQGWTKHDQNSSYHWPKRVFADLSEEQKATLIKIVQFTNEIIRD